MAYLQAPLHLPFNRLSPSPCIFVQCMIKRYETLETWVSVLKPQIYTCYTAIGCWSVFLAVTPASVPRNTQKHEPVLVPLANTSSQVQSNLRQSLTNKELIFRRQLLVTQLISAAWPPALLLCSLRRRSCCSGCKGCPKQRACECLEYRNNVSACCVPSISFSTGPRIVIKSNPSLLLFGGL